MRLATMDVAGSAVAVMAVDDRWHRIGDVGHTLRDQIAGGLTAASPGEEVPSSAALLAPFAPGKIVAIGLNYMDHIRETGMDAPERPVVFAKFPSSVTGPEHSVVLDPALSARVDWEVELGVIIGRRARNVRAEDALAFVLGYTVANDLSARDVQFSDGQWVRGKSFDGFCPIGPWIVTADEIEDPQNLGLRTRVNGETVQNSSTAEMVFGVRDLIGFCSRSFTLEPGDVLLTGTPWGVGEFMTPRRSLAPGDVVECEIDRIGVLRNEMVAP